MYFSAISSTVQSRYSSTQPFMMAARICLLASSRFTASSYCSSRLGPAVPFSLVPCPTKYSFLPKKLGYSCSFRKYALFCALHHTVTIFRQGIPLFICTMIIPSAYLRGKVPCASNIPAPPISTLSPFYFFLDLPPWHFPLRNMPLLIPHNSFFGICRSGFTPSAALPPGRS